MNALTTLPKKNSPTPEQQKVIDSREKYIVVTACAGAGKTATLVQRFGALPPDESKLVLAFNKEAATEFSKRLVGGEICESVKTFHSFCLRLIMGSPNTYGFMRKPTIETEAQPFALLKAATQVVAQGWEESPWSEDFVKGEVRLMYDHEVQEYMIANKPIIYWDELNKIKEEYLKSIPSSEREKAVFPQDIMDIEETLREWESCKAVLQMRKYLQISHIVTFDEMVRLVAESRHHLNININHIMVDEFQDVDKFQFDIVKALGRLNGLRSLTVVGDARQTIYQWRGALDDSFGKFCDTFGQVQKLELNVCFRSKDEIIGHANVIFPEYTSMKGVRGKGNKVLSVTQDSDDNKDFFDKAAGWSQHAILCRYNRGVAMWSLKLARGGVPCLVVGKGEFWNQPPIKLAMAARVQKLSIVALLETEEWHKLMSKKKYRLNEDNVEEAIQDAKFIIELSDSDYTLLRSHLNNKDGVRISTIHKTKGLEFQRVMVVGVNEALTDERELYYVACTRAKDYLRLSKSSDAKLRAEIKRHVETSEMKDVTPKVHQIEAPQQMLLGTSQN